MILRAPFPAFFIDSNNDVVDDDDDDNLVCIYILVCRHWYD
jgi:hypothetical protein